MLSPNQESVYRFMLEYVRVNHNMPSVDEIAKHFNWASGNAAEEVKQALVKKGFLEKYDSKRGKYRFTQARIVYIHGQV